MAIFYFYAELSIVYFLFYLTENGVPLVGAEERINNDSASCDVNGVCYDQQLPVKESEQCLSSSRNLEPLSISVDDFYRQGVSAQAYKPNAPVKEEVCQVGNGSFYSELTYENWGEDHSFRDPNNVAHSSIWRSKYNDVVPVMAVGDIYSCGPVQLPLPSLSSDDAAKMEVWQPRPDGTFSSVRPGVEEGVCRATVTIDSGVESNFSNLIGKVKFDTLAPGSPGILGGLTPNSYRDYPPYGPGSIHMYLNVDGYHPVLVKLDMNDLEEHMLEKDLENRFHFKGSDMRPHAKSNAKNDYHGIEIQSVKGMRSKFPGYEYMLNVNFDLYLVPNDEYTSSDLSDVFCASNGFSSWISSFFKEPIAICFPSLLDFFSL